MTVHTRFPPEPNGYLHIGHCKALTIDFGTAEKFGGLCNLRMDDTNPTKEDEEFVDAIQQDIHWLGFDWGDRFFYGSDYFDEDYRQAVGLIKKGLAYVCELTPEQFKEYRGDTTTPARSPWRDRPIEESLDLFERMKNGEFPEGRYTLRAKIDLESGNFNMRDPVLYRINYLPHHRQGNKWCIYPMYDFAHPLEDAIEGITHSICTMEFEDHRPLYDWVVREAGYTVNPPRQIEFARLNLTNTVMSKRKLRALVENGLVDGWDDPRMPTVSGLRRRGYTPESIRDFCERIGVSKANSCVDSALLDYCLREDLKTKAKVVMAVLDPVKVVITNYPEGQIEFIEIENNPENPELGKRTVPFGREVYIEREDFMEEPVKKYQRLYPGNEVRIKSAYIVKCTGCKKDENGNDLPEIDWSKTRAVASREEHIYINLKGRDPEGIVDPADQYELEEEIMTALYGYRDAKTGHRVVSVALRNRDAVLLGQGGPEAGDICYWLAEGYNFDHADCLSTTLGEGDTSVSPIFIASGRGIKQGFYTERIIRQIDFAPTVAVLGGVRMPAQCEGAPAYQILGRGNIKPN